MYVNKEIRRKWQARTSQYVSIILSNVEGSDVYLYFSIICMGVLLVCLSLECVHEVAAMTKVIDGTRDKEGSMLPWSVL